MRKAPARAVAEVLLFSGSDDCNQSGFLCGFYSSAEAAAAAQQLIEYVHGNAAFVRPRNTKGVR